MSKRLAPFLKRHMVKIDAGNLVLQSSLLGVQLGSPSSLNIGSDLLGISINIVCVVIAWRWLMSSSRSSHKPSTEAWAGGIEEYEQELKRREGIAP